MTTLRMCSHETQLGPESGAVGRLPGAASGTQTKVAAAWSYPGPLWCGRECHPHPGSRTGLAGVSAMRPCVWPGPCDWRSRVLGAVCLSMCHVPASPHTHTRPQAALLHVWVEAGPGAGRQQSRAGRACAPGSRAAHVCGCDPALHGNVRLPLSFLCGGCTGHRPCCPCLRCAAS